MKYGIYSVEEEWQPDGKWKGYRCSVLQSTGKQGKLYPRTDGRENYKTKPKDEELGFC